MKIHQTTSLILLAVAVTAAPTATNAATGFGSNKAIGTFRAHRRAAFPQQFGLRRALTFTPVAAARTAANHLGRGLPRRVFALNGGAGLETRYVWRFRFEDGAPGELRHHGNQWTVYRSGAVYRQLWEHHRQNGRVVLWNPTDAVWIGVSETTTYWSRNGRNWFPLYARSFTSL